MGPTRGAKTKRKHKPKRDDFHYGELSDEVEEAERPPKADGVFSAVSSGAAAAPPGEGDLDEDDEDGSADFMPEEEGEYDFEDVDGYIRDVAFSFDSLLIAAVGMDSQVWL